MVASEIGPAPAAAGTTPAASSEVPTWWRELRLSDLDGKPLNPAGRWLVVIFLGQECPVSNASLPRLNELAREFEPQGGTFVGAYVDPTADLVTLRRHAADFAIRFPVVDDRTHRLAHAAGATSTPEVAVFSRGGEKLYQGGIDDRVGDGGIARPAAVHDFLRDVLRALVAGKTGPFPLHPTYGCTIPEPIAR